MSLNRDFEKILLGGYRWLSENYREGDRIYLFGVNDQKRLVHAQLT